MQTVPTDVPGPPRQKSQATEGAASRSKSVVAEPRARPRVQRVGRALRQSALGPCAGQNRHQPQLPSHRSGRLERARAVTSAAAHAIIWRAAGLRAGRDEAKIAAASAPLASLVINVHIFFSHNHRDKDLATPLAAQLRLVGAEVWLDDWEIKPGDSIVGKVNNALGLVDTVLLLWSRNAAASRWVNSKMESALSRALSDGSPRIIPIRLDDTELPLLLQPIKWLRMDDPGAVSKVARVIMGIDSQESFIKAIQQTIDESGLTYEYFHGFGVAVGYPKCGAPASELEQWSETDYERDDEYAVVRCNRCGWGTVARSEG